MVDLCWEILSFTLCGLSHISQTIWAFYKINYMVRVAGKVAINGKFNSCSRVAKVSSSLYVYYMVRNLNMGKFLG